METNLLTIRLNGVVVAEAQLVVHDAPAAWRAFQDAFANIAPYVTGELFNTMRVACDPALLKEMGEQGIVINLDLPQPAQFPDSQTILNGRYRED